MTDIWAISDTHFLHANILKFTNDEGKIFRPFPSLKAMDEYMIHQWNSVVKPQDHVYHLGDVTFQYHGLFQEIMHQLHGHKRLVVGNHDKLNDSLLKHFDKVMLWRHWKHESLMFSHIPLRQDQLKNCVNVHGHLHQRQMKEPGYISVCVELRNYTPVHLDQLTYEAKTGKMNYRDLNNEQLSVDSRSE